MTTTSVSGTDTALTTDDVTAMRLAESIAFHHADGEPGSRSYLTRPARGAHLHAPFNYGATPDIGYGGGHGGTGSRSRPVPCEGTVSGDEQRHLSAPLRAAVVAGIRRHGGKAAADRAGAEWFTPRSA